MLKTLVTFGGVPLSGAKPIVWAFTTGTTPFSSTFEVHSDHWPRIQRMIDSGRPQELVISDSTRKVRIKQLFAIHNTAPGDPYTRRFEVVDKRYWWQYPGVARDYNLAKKTGNRTIFGKKQTIKVPSAPEIVFDQIDYRQYTLGKTGKKRWTAQEAVKDILEQLEPADPKRKSYIPFRIDSFPIKDGGQFPLQNVMLADNGDIALDRLLGYIPGAALYIDSEGTAVVYNAADLSAAERHKAALPTSTYDGDFPDVIRRKAIRPKEIHVMYQREVEVVFVYTDDYGAQTSTAFNRETPFCENVIPTTDPETLVTYNDPDSPGKLITGKVPAGTWIPIRAWLEAMEDLRLATDPVVGWPWTFNTIRMHWNLGGLDGAFGARPDGKLDFDELGSLSARVNALKDHFRTHFQVNRRVMERVQDITAVRASMNPMTGQQVPARAWGQMTISPNHKGLHMQSRFDPKASGVHVLLDRLPNDEGDLIERSPLPLAVTMVDRDMGIFKISFTTSPYGTDAEWWPGHLEYDGATNSLTVPTMNLSDLDRNGTSVILGAKKQGSTNAHYLARKMEMRFILSIVPGAPNNKTRYHTVKVKASEVQEVYQSTYHITGGEGPPMDVFVNPGELAARFEWKDDVDANTTIKLLLGLDKDDPNKAGLPPDNPKTKHVDESAMNGYLLVNDGDQENGRHLKGHALTVAAEVYASYADSIEGSMNTRLPKLKTARDPWLVGNMESAAIEVAAYPDATVTVSHEFPGKQAPISRMALFPEMVRRLVLGIVPLRMGDK